MFTVKISKLKVHTKIGVYATENTKSQLLLVTLKFSYKVHKNKNADSIGNLKSYSEVKHFIKKYIESSRYKTLEKLIIESSKALKKKFRIQTFLWKLKNQKPRKNTGVLSVSVTK
jgi:FolB domain-containing protein